MGGGPATASGSDFQSRVFAFIAVHILRERSLRWLDNTPDTPSAVLSETGGPGDDFGIEFVDSPVFVEAQAKHGLRADSRFWETIQFFAERWDATPDALGVLIVDSDSSRTIRRVLRRDLRRLRQNRDDHQADITRKVLRELGERTAQLYIAEVDIDTDSSHGLGHAQEMLGNCLVHAEQAPAAWRSLVAEGLEQAKDRGRAEKKWLEGMLSKQHLQPKALQGAFPNHRLFQGALAPTNQAVAASTQLNREDVVLEEANSHLKQGRPRVGLKLLEQLDEIEVAARPVKTRLLRASCLLASGDVPASIRELREAADYGSDDDLVRSNLAQALLLGGQAEEAVKLARQTIGKRQGCCRLICDHAAAA